MGGGSWRLHVGSWWCLWDSRFASGLVDNDKGFIPNVNALKKDEVRFLAEAMDKPELGTVQNEITGLTSSVISKAKSSISLDVSSIAVMAMCTPRSVLNEMSEEKPFEKVTQVDRSLIEYRICSFCSWFWSTDASIWYSRSTGRNRVWWKVTTVCSADKQLDACLIEQTFDTGCTEPNHLLSTEELQKATNFIGELLTDAVHQHSPFNSQTNSIRTSSQTSEVLLDWKVWYSPFSKATEASTAEEFLIPPTDVTLECTPAP